MELGSTFLFFTNHLRVEGRLPCHNCHQPRLADWYASQPQLAPPILRWVDHTCVAFLLDMMAARRKSNVVPVWRFLRNRCNGEGLQLQLRCTLALATLTTRALKRPSCTQSRRSIAPALTPFSFPLLLLFFFLSLFFFKNMKLNGMLSERAGFTTTPRITASLSGEGRPFRSL